MHADGEGGAVCMKELQSMLTGRTTIFREEGIVCTDELQCSLTGVGRGGRTAVQSDGKKLWCSLTSREELRCSLTKRTTVF